MLLLHIKKTPALLVVLIVAVLIDVICSAPLPEPYRLEPLTQVAVFAAFMVMVLIWLFLGSSKQTDDEAAE